MANTPFSFEEVYAQLRAIARQHLRHERHDHTLQATALVNEAWIRIHRDQPVEWSDRGRLIAAAVEAMRRILIDHARARASQKRGGGPDGRPAHKLPLDGIELARVEDFSTLLSVSDAISRLKNTDAQLAQLVELRFFCGLSDPEAAETLGLTLRTVQRHWVVAKAWLRRELGAGLADDEQESM